MSDLKPQAESLESLLSTAIGLLMGHKERIGYKPDSVIAKFVNECVERLKDWPYTDEAQPAPITSESGNQAAQGASAITSESAQAGALLTKDEIRKLHAVSGGCVNGYGEFARAIEQAVCSKLGAGVGWQSIRTAPKDGTHILAVLPDRDTCYVICWVDAAKEIRSYLSVGAAAAGWHHAYDGDPIAPHDHPTHWQPLPPPPGIVGKEGA